MSRRDPEAASGVGNQQRSRVAARLQGSVKELLGKRAPSPTLQPVAPPEVQHERRVPPQRWQLEPIKLTPNVPTQMYHQRADMPEHVGVFDRRGNTVMATFDLPGRERPVNFSVIRRDDGWSPSNAAAGFPESLSGNRLSYGRDVTTVTVMPTELYQTAIREMNNKDIDERRFWALHDEVNSASATITHGGEIGMGRDSEVFGGMLSREASGKHMIIGLTERKPGSGLMDADVFIEDYSANGIDNVVQQPTAVGHI